jgi:hypothetical protein
VNSESDEDKLDRIKSEIRTDADAARRRVTLPERASGRNVLNGSQGGDRHVSIAELAQHSGPTFVDHAYRTILRRPPDSEGFARQMAMLGAGASKIEVLGDLRYSAEGRRHGSKIPGLLPRYALAKVGRVPVLGALMQWLIVAAALPHLLRHQRATEASLAVRFGETAAALQAAEHRDAELREAIDATQSDLASAVAELSDRLARTETSTHLLRQHIDGVGINVAELRQLALSMNHWTVQVRKSIDAIEGAEAERRERNDETSAAIILRAREHDAGRATRLQAWADELARRIPRDGTLLDLAGGSDWLAELSAHGWSASSIETNAALHRDARARKLDVTFGSPGSFLARIADASLDALTIVSPDRIADEMPATELLREARRILKHGGCLMIGTTPTEFSAEYVSPEILLAVGFADPKRLDAFPGNATFAVRT